MKRLITAISLLAVAGILCGIGFFSMKKQVDTLTQMLDQAAAAAQKEDVETLRTQTDELQREWEKSHVIFSMLIQHRDLDALEMHITSLPNLLDEQDFREYNRTCEEGVLELSHIYKAEIPSVGNVF